MSTLMKSSRVIIDLSSDEEDGGGVCTKGGGVGLSKSSGVVVDDDDDECVILDGDPDQPIKAVKDETGVGSDELLVVAEKGKIACRDYPHARHLCARFPFSSNPHEKYCDLCHCYVCDVRAPCARWGTGSSSGDHCHSTDKEEIWISQRRMISELRLCTLKDKSTGIVKRLDINKGYGMITPDNGGRPLIFLHSSESEGYQHLAKGEPVEFQILLGKDGTEIMAFNVRVIGNSSVSGANRSTGGYHGRAGVASESFNQEGTGHLACDSYLGGAGDKGGNVGRNEHPIRAGVSEAYSDSRGSGGRVCYDSGEPGHLARDCGNMSSGDGSSTEHDSGIICYNCHEYGHKARDCKNNHWTVQGIICYTCGENGHKARDCNKGSKSRRSTERDSGIQCYNCHEYGHKARDCKNNHWTVEGIICYTCGENGHKARDCNKGSKSGRERGSGSRCYNRNEYGHFERDCENNHWRVEGGRSYEFSSGGRRFNKCSSFSCYTCGQEGHFARECPTAQ